MIKILPESVIEIWSTEYIDDPSSRMDRDRNAQIVQIEEGNITGDYMVEIIRR